MLFLLQELTFGSPLKEALGKIIFESVPFTLGVALANQFLGDGDNSNGQGQTNSQGNTDKKKQRSHLYATCADLGATIIGATVIAFNIAPTDEIPMLAATVSPPWFPC